MLELAPWFAAQLPRDINVFDYIMGLEGEMFREMDNRRTLRFSLGGKRYFLKAHYGVGWKEIIKNLLQLRMPVLGARNEWLAIQRLQQLGIETMTLVGHGERGRNPATRQSFVITEALENTHSLEDFCADWEASPPESKSALRLKRDLINRVAAIARELHTHGLNHRDFYICHFLLDVSADLFTKTLDSSMRSDDCMPDTMHLFLIDLHRVQIRARTPLRWLVKDIGGLYFSSMRIGLTRRDLYRFMKVYRDTTLRETLSVDGKFWSRCRLRACSLYHSFYNELPPAN